MSDTLIFNPRASHVRKADLVDFLRRVNRTIYIPNSITKSGLIELVEKELALSPVQSAETGRSLRSKSATSSPAKSPTQSTAIKPVPEMKASGKDISHSPSVRSTKGQLNGNSKGSDSSPQHGAGSIKDCLNAPVPSKAKSQKAKGRKSTQKSPAGAGKSSDNKQSQAALDMVTHDATHSVSIQSCEHKNPAKKTLSSTTPPPSPSKLPATPKKPIRSCFVFGSNAKVDHCGSSDKQPKAGFNIANIPAPIHATIFPATPSNKSEKPLPEPAAMSPLKLPAADNNLAGSLFVFGANSNLNVVSASKAFQGNHGGLKKRRHSSFDNGEAAQDLNLVPQPEKRLLTASLPADTDSQQVVNSIKQKHTDEPHTSICYPPAIDIKRIINASDEDHNYPPLQCNGGPFTHVTREEALGEISEKSHSTECSSPAHHKKQTATNSMKDQESPQHNPNELQLVVRSTKGIFPPPVDYFFSGVWENQKHPLGQAEKLSTAVKSIPIPLEIDGYLQVAKRSIKGMCPPGFPLIPLQDNINEEMGESDLAEPLHNARFPYLIVNNCIAASALEDALLEALTS